MSRITLHIFHPLFGPAHFWDHQINVWTNITPNKLLPTMYVSTLLPSTLSIDWDVSVRDAANMWA